MYCRRLLPLLARGLPGYLLGRVVLGALGLTRLFGDVARCDCPLPGAPYFKAQEGKCSCAGAFNAPTCNCHNFYRTPTP